MKTIPATVVMQANIASAVHLLEGAMPELAAAHKHAANCAPNATIGTLLGQVERIEAAARILRATVDLYTFARGGTP